MAVIRWNPWTVTDFFENNWDLPTIPGISKLMGHGLTIYEKEDEIVAEAAVPGISEDNIDVSIDDDVVRIAAHKEDKQEEKDQRKYFMSSMSSSYNYSFRLPGGVVAEKDPLCELQDGVLTMRFPKMQKSPPKKLKVEKMKVGKTK